ncbi:MAG: DUF86 domain-containing protein [Nitrospirae bacterium]|nr:DUF86 domain-containing protein [Nitrospirota bacterium]
MIDVQLVTRKLSLILQDLPALVELARKNADEYVSSPIHEVLAERYLERVIGRMIDINYHLLTELGHPPPKDYHESFVKLGVIGILPGQLAQDIAFSAGLRNRIVHEYDDIDPRKVHGALQIATAQFPIYLEAVRRSLERLRP